MAMKYVKMLILSLVVLEVNSIGYLEGARMLQKLNRYIHEEKTRALGILKREGEVEDGLVMTNKELFSKYEVGRSLLIMIEEFKKFHEVAIQMNAEMDKFLEAPADKEDMVVLGKMGMNAKKISKQIQNPDKVNEAVDVILEHIKGSDIEEDIHKLINSMHKEEL